MDINGEPVAMNHSVVLQNKSRLRCGETYLYFLLPEAEAVAQRAAAAAAAAAGGAMIDDLPEDAAGYHAAAHPAKPGPRGKGLGVSYKHILDTVSSGAAQPPVSGSLGMRAPPLLGLAGLRESLSKAGVLHGPRRPAPRSYRVRIH